MALFKVYYDSSAIHPKFTLLDKSKTSSIDNELDLDGIFYLFKIIKIILFLYYQFLESYLLLTAQINTGKFKITFMDSNKKVIFLFKLKSLSDFIIINRSLFEHVGNNCSS